MFTGIVKDVGSVSAVSSKGSGLRMVVRYSNHEAFVDLEIDESVAIDGACQTVVAKGNGVFEVDTIAETLKKTTLGSFTPGRKVNLERAIRPIDRLGGHFVQGHVDCVGEVFDICDLGESREIWVSYPDAYASLLVPVGSVAIDGVSLTVAAVEKGRFAVAIIPYTFGNTTINALKKGSRVNLEFDILGKYIARQRKIEQDSASPSSSISDTWLREMGY